MRIGAAIERLEQSARLSRDGWNGRGIYIEMQFPDSNSKMTGPYIYIDTTGLQGSNESAPRCRVPWVPSITDLLASDWGIVE